MQDRRKACLILGIPEEATSKEIEDRYFILVKRYKNLAQDEQPSPGEPIFATINEAYRFLTGFVPMQKIQMRDLKWKEKFQHIRENYMMEITYFVVIVLFVCAVGTGIHEMYKAVQAGIKDPGVYSPAEILPLPISKHQTNNENVTQE
ncbi:J domain-containing protein [Paenibacillus eucommiae]|uniref:J domain-containing protein n=1 Tax=Paenibacillus eucommiae TaxID=1355755 RepID=A0ABS4IYS2_9BACL|nr:J domain-containing protein [Paenibacillus eucommiae]MBP1992736.1 hypothetical protein [Paenibacillus eucommiae]